MPPPRAPQLGQAALITTARAAAPGAQTDHRTHARGVLLAPVPVPLAERLIDPEVADGVFDNDADGGDARLKTRSSGGRGSPRGLRRGMATRGGGTRSRAVAFL